MPSIVKVMTKFTKTNYLSLDFFYAVLVVSDLQPVHMLVSKLVPFYTELHLAYNLLTEYPLTSIIWEILPSVCCDYKITVNSMSLQVHE